MIRFYYWLHRLGAWLVVYSARKRGSALYAHAEREFRLGGFEDDPDIGKWLRQSVLELVATLSGQGHSGGSVGWARNLFVQLASYKPLGPLTGADEECCQRPITFPYTPQTKVIDIDDIDADWEDNFDAVNGRFR